jgi:hypothetical protein
MVYGCPACIFKWGERFLYQNTDAGAYPLMGDRSLIRPAVVIACGLYRWIVHEYELEQAELGTATSGLVARSGP